MVKKNRVSLLLHRNKRGHPIYSREDIREQYCINRKEVEVLESARSIKFLGCFTNQEDGSPCGKNSILFSCIHKKKRSNSDDNIYEHAGYRSGDVTATTTPIPYDSDRTYDEDPKSTYDDRSTDDEEFVLKKRPKAICDLEARQARNSWLDSQSVSWEAGGSIRRRKLESSASFGSTSQQSYDESEREVYRNIQRPSELVIVTRSRNEPFCNFQYFQPSHSVDELNDAYRRSGVPRTVKTPDISLEDRRPKHVSFDNGSLVRSNTVGGGLEDVMIAAQLDSGPVATSTPLYTQRRAFSPPLTSTPRSRSRERLLDRSYRHLSDLGDRVSVTSSTMTTITIKPDEMLSYKAPPSQPKPRRVAMKTQATQTELTFKDRFALPDYLTLSPRARKTTSSCQAQLGFFHPSRHRSAPRPKSATAMTKSRSAHGAMVSADDDTDDEVMEVDLAGKHHRLVRTMTSRASIRRQRAFDASQEEIMVSFKPAQSPKQPRRPIEVLLGERPIPRYADRERKVHHSSAFKSSTDPRKDDRAEEKVIRISSRPSERKLKAVEHKTPEPLPSKEPIEQSHSLTIKEKTAEPEQTVSVPTIPALAKSQPVEEKQSPEESSDMSGVLSSSGRLMGFKTAQDSMETSSLKSSYESLKAEPLDSQQLASEKHTVPSNHEQREIVTSSSHSAESHTSTYDETPSPTVIKAQELYQKKKDIYMTQYRKHASSKKTVCQETATSPDSESSSSIFTERETSKSEVSTSSSNNKIAKSDSESSEYVTAPDHSYKDSRGSQKQKVAEDAHTSFESFSSPSSRSSLYLTPLQAHQKSSTSPSSSTSLLPMDDDIVPTAMRTESQEEKIREVRDDEFDDSGLLSPPPLPLTLPLEDDHLESSDESTKKDESKSSENDDVELPDWRYRRRTSSTRGTPDSDRTSDITPVFDASPEPLSSLLEDGVQTVIEVYSGTAVSSASRTVTEISAKYDNGSQSSGLQSTSLGNGEGVSPKEGRGESESSDSSCVLSGLQDLESASRVGVGMDAGGNRIHIQLYEPSEPKTEELSTVSEVSEDSSQADTNGSKKRGQRPRYLTSGRHLSEDAAKKSSSSEYIASEGTTSSFESTTSGSFVIENDSGSSSYNNGEKSNSDVEFKNGDFRTTPQYETKHPEHDVPVSPEESTTLGDEETVMEREIIRTIKGKEGKQPDVEKSRKTSSSASSATSEHSEKLPTPSSTTTPFSSSSSSLIHEHRSDEPTASRRPERPVRSRSVDEPQHSLSAWCSEGAIAKQKVHDGTNETRRRRERNRMRSESRDHAPSLQLVPPDQQRHYPRSKSHSPEKSEDEDLNSSSAGGPPYKGHLSKRLLCSQCGERIRDQSIPHSAPPPSKWERQYQRSFFPMPPQHSHQQHQSLMWRHLQQQKGRSFGEGFAQADTSRYSSYSGAHPRSWSTETGAHIEADLYPDEDEDAGIHSESYRLSNWIYVTESDELAVWQQPIDKSSKSDETFEEEAEPSVSSSSSAAVRRQQQFQLARSDSSESTSSEHEFLRQYQAVTHRMVHRKSSAEMYNRMANRSFEVDKRVVVQRNNGEFGFRIHGSKPVVVSAIEKDTPAETCGLEVGDIIVCINGQNVLDASHSEVVRIAHTGTELLKMEVTRTCHVLAPVLSQSPPTPVYAGFLQRLSARSVTGRRWCRRWFAVRADSVLYWYRTKKDHEPLGALVLQSQSISRVPEAGAPHAFKVSRFGGCPFYFSADDEDTASKWISALNQVANNASRSDIYMDQSVRFAQIVASCVPRPDCQGMLAKLSQRWKNWRRRYFLLKDAALYFYVDRNAKVALGLFHLQGYKVQSCSLQGKKNTFEIIPPEPRLKHLYFQADSENDKRRWLAALEYSIDRWIKVG